MQVSRRCAANLCHTCTAGLCTVHSPSLCTVRYTCRSDVIPMFESGVASWESLMQQPQFVFDALFLHARANHAPRCQEIFNFLTGLEQPFEGASGFPKNQFFLEVVRTNERRFYEKMALLLAHSGELLFFSQQLGLLSVCNARPTWRPVSLRNKIRANNSSYKYPINVILKSMEAPNRISFTFAKLWQTIA